MTTVKLPIIVWNDGYNYYCKLLFQPFNYPKDYNCFISTTVDAAKNDLLKSAEKVFNQNGWNEYDSDSTIHLGVSRVKIKPII